MKMTKQQDKDWDEYRSVIYDANKLRELNRVRFTNKIVRQVRKNKPHIQLIGGYWRVSASPHKPNYEGYHRWNMAHIVIYKWNERRIRGM